MRLLLFLLLFPLSQAVSSQIPVFKNFTVKEGLSSNFVYDIIQDSKDFLWIATENGVCRFDGTNFKTFTGKDGLADIEIFKIREDTKGRIWFLSYNGKLSFFQNGLVYNQKNVPFLKGLNFNYLIRELYEDQEGNIWVSSQEEGFKCLTRQNEIKTFYEPDGRYDQLIRIYESGGKLFAESSSHRYKIEKFEPVPVPKTSSSYVSDNSGKQEIVKYRNSSFYTSRDTIPFYAENRVIHDVLIDQDSKFWLATNLGLFSFRNGNMEVFFREKITTSILQDKEGNIWISTLGNGVFMKPVISFHSLIDPEKFTSPSVYSLFKSGDTLIAGSSNGSVFLIRLDNYSVNEIRMGSGKEPNKVRSVFKDSWGKIWCGTDRGIFVIEKNKSCVHLKKKFPVKDLFVNEKEELFFASTSGLIKIDSKTLQEKVISSKRTTAVSFAKGRLIAGSLAGIVDIKEYAFLKDQRITKVLSDGNRQFFGTYGNGLYVKSGDSLQHFTEKTELPGNVIKDITRAGKNLYWIATNKGLCRIAFSAHGDEVISLVSFSSKHGLPSQDIHRVLVAGNILFFASEAGVTTLVSNVKRSRENFPKMYITGIFSNNRPVNSSELLNLKNDENDLRFEFTAVSLSSLGDVQYEYYLEGFEKKWNKINANVAEYRNLKPGKYKFLIRAISKYGFKSNHAEAEFLIIPPFTSTPLFKSTLGIILLVAFGLAGFVIWKIQKNKHEEKIRLLRLEQHALASQMNPHFIFNCLNSIQQFILSADKLSANKYLTNFAGLIRNFLENGKKSVISLEEEIETLFLYTQLENFRINNRIEINISKPAKDCSHIYIPSMLIQPLVENSILHGLIPLDDSIRKPRLDIEFGLDRDQLEVRIKDNGIGRSGARQLQQSRKNHNSTAITNIIERIRILNKMKGFRGEFLIEDITGKDGRPEGTLARIRLYTDKGFYGKNNNSNY